MTVEIVKSWIFPQVADKMEKSNKENPLFYIAVLQDHRKRYLKIGTTERTIKERFSQKDYKAYTNIKLLYVAEVTCDKNPKFACYQIEDLTRSAIREAKGFNFVKNDRFKFFQLPPVLPVYTSFNSCILIDTKRKD